MIIVAIIKASGIRTSVDSFDLVWELFWQQVEACTAVLMVSFTAFRSTFISNKPKADKSDVRPNVIRRFQCWLTSNKASGRGVQHLSPSTQAEQIPPHVTLGTRFQSIQHIGLLRSQVQPMSQTASSPYSQNPELGLQEEPEDSETFATRDDGVNSFAVTDSGSCEHQSMESPLSFTSSQGREQKSRGHWWQIGILSNFTLSRSRGHDSEV